jgi:hypothetical protein
VPSLVAPAAYFKGMLSLIQKDLNLEGHITEAPLESSSYRQQTLSLSELQVSVTSRPEVLSLSRTTPR